MKRKLIEPLKSLLIVALAASAVFLAYKSDVFNEFFAEAALPERWAAYFGNDEQQSSAVGSDVEIGAGTVPAKPVTMVVTGDVGARCGIKYDEAQLNAMYERTVNIFGEALGSATKPEKCSENDWREALMLPGIYLDYEVELPVSALVTWLGMSALNDNDSFASRFAVVIDRSAAVNVYYADETSFYRCGSAAAAESLMTVMQEFLPNGAYFAFESEEVDEMVSPYTLVMPSISDKYILEPRNMMDEKGMRDRLADMLGMNILGGASYAEKNGTMVYVGVNGILRVNADGAVNYSATNYEYAEDELIRDTDADELIERAFGIVSNIRAGYGGKEKLYVSDIEVDEDSCAVSFSYYVDGTAIVQRSGSAAAVMFSGGRLVALDMWMRSYHASAEKATLLPELQAAAIAGGIDKNSDLKLVYHDDGTAAVQPMWTVS